MKIDRSNYELWLIDWLDGKLDDEQAGQLELFLQANNDLREEFSDLRNLRVDPPSIEFRGKKGLRRDYSDLSDLQFDYLCAARLENDLSEEEVHELLKITSENPGRKKVLDIFEKTRLVPPDKRFRNRKSLHKETTPGKIARISAWGLSTAATVAIIAASYLFISGELNSREKLISQYLKNEGRASHSNTPAQSDDRFYLSNTEEDINSYLSNDSFTGSGTVSEEAAAILATPAIHNTEISKEEIISFVRIPVGHAIPPFYNPDIANISLIDLSFDIQPEDKANRLISGFLAKTFRQRILKEETSDESPIKGYEIAEAGVSGLNRLFGWQMALEKNNDENGEVRSLYFNSKILKIQTPVKRPETAE